MVIVRILLETCVFTIIQVGTMALECIFDIARDHVICRVSGQFTVEDGVRVIQSTVTACNLNGHKHALIDATGIETPVAATTKIIAAHKVEELFDKLSEMGQTIPRIAVFCTTYFIGQYKSVSECFQMEGIPFRFFDSIFAAKEWLFAS
jgi:hypothetical protein